MSNASQDKTGYSILSALTDRETVDSTIDSGVAHINCTTLIANYVNPLTSDEEGELCKFCGAKATCGSHHACDEHHSLAIAEMFMSHAKEYAGDEYAGKALAAMAQVSVAVACMLALDHIDEHPEFRVIAELLQGVMSVSTIDEASALQYEHMLQQRIEEASGLDLSVWQWGDDD